MMRALDQRPLRHLESSDGRTHVWATDCKAGQRLTFSANGTIIYRRELSETEAQQYLRDLLFKGWRNLSASVAMD